MHPDKSRKRTFSPGELEAWWVQRHRVSWCIVFGDAAFGMCTKTKKIDDTLIVEMPGCEWMNDLLSAFGGSAPSGRMFPQLTLARLERLFRIGSEALDPKPFNLTPYKTRHAGLSPDVLHGILSDAKVQERLRNMFNQSKTSSLADRLNSATGAASACRSLKGVRKAFKQNKTKQYPCLCSEFNTR